MHRWALILFSLLLTTPTQALSGNTVIVEAPMGKIWSEYTGSTEVNVLRLVEVLERSHTGKALVTAAAAKARASGLTLNDLITAGEGSLTDTTLIRKFHPDSPEDVAFETRSRVYINKHLAWREALLDLAHELTHYVSREPFNPYTLNFSLGDFVRSTIEGKGGEAHAFVNECLVMRELFTTELAQDSNCAQIGWGQDSSTALSRASALFYHMGSFYPQMKKVVDERGILKDFPSLSDQKIKFISSAYGLPYPLAAIQEYQSVLSKVCENDRRRLTYMAAPRGRAPASLEKFRVSVEERCRTVSQVSP